MHQECGGEVYGDGIVHSVSDAEQHDEKILNNIGRKKTMLFLMMGTAGKKLRNFLVLAAMAIWLFF